jgi:hypothetical protein
MATERPDIGYAMIFPAATIVKVVSVQIVGLALLGRRGGARRRLPSQAIAKALGEATTERVEARAAASRQMTSVAKTVRTTAAFSKA